MDSARPTSQCKYSKNSKYIPANESVLTCLQVSIAIVWQKYGPLRYKAYGASKPPRVFGRNFEKFWFLTHVGKI